MANTYTTYKDSGIPWIGEIPKEWEICRLKNIGTSQNGLTYSTSEIVSETEGVLVLRSSNIQNGKLYFDDNVYVSTEIPQSLFVKVGDIIICSRNGSASLVGKCAIVEENITATFGAFMMRFQSDYNHKYIFYLLSCAISQYKQLFSTTTINQLTVGVFGNLNMPFIHSNNEQEQIVSYLDEKCSEIDDLISLQEKMIDELKAYKQSVITEAVTKGLDRNVKMKDSGVEWIGEIPEHWELRPIKYLFNRRSHKNSPVETTERLSLSIDKGVTLYSEKTTNLDRFKDDYTQYQLAHPNDIVLNSMNMIVGAIGLSQYFGCVSPVYYVIYASNKEISSLYFSYALNTPTIRSVYYSMGKGIYAIERGEGRVNTCRLKVSYDDFGRLEIPVPPYQEQIEITNFIETKCSEIDSLISIKENKIEELKDYKKSLIYEYVTGKKRV